MRNLILVTFISFFICMSCFQNEKQNANRKEAKQEVEFKEIIPPKENKNLPEKITDPKPKLDKKKNKKRVHDQRMIGIKRSLNEHLKKKRPSFKLETSSRQYNYYLSHDKFQDCSKFSGKFLNHIYDKKAIDTIKKSVEFSEEQDRYGICLSAHKSSKDFQSKIIYRKSEGGHSDDVIFLTLINFKSKAVYNLLLFYNYGQEKFDLLIESSIKDGYIERRLKRRIGWGTMVNGEKLQPTSETIQKFRILESGEIELVEEKTTNYNFDVYLNFESDDIELNEDLYKDKDCEKFITGFVKMENGDSNGWFKDGKGNWIDTTLGEKYKYMSYPPRLDEKHYYPNFTVYINFGMSVILNDIKDKLKVMVKNDRQELVTWIKPLNDMKLLETGNYTQVKIDESSGRSISFDSENGMTHFSVSQKGNLLVCDVSQNGGAEKVVYNLKGEVVYRNKYKYASKEATISKDSRYLAYSCGGTDDSEGNKSPLSSYVYDLQQQKYVLNLSSDDECFETGFWRNSNWFIILQKKCGEKHAINTYISNVESGGIYKLNLPEVKYMTMTFCPEVEMFARQTDGKTPVFLNKDFTVLDDWPF